MSPINLETRGLNYDPDFLESLPVLQQRPSPYTPFRALSAHQFAQIHLDYLSRHSRDHSPSHVLFPYLHGIEGDNDAQNSFFAQNQTQPIAAQQANGDANADGVRPTVSAKPLPPKFRGLIWVSADDLPVGDMVSSDDEDIDELDSEMDSLTEEDDYTSESSDSLVDAPIDMDIDVAIPPPHSPTMMDEEVEAEMQLDPTLNGPVVNGCPPLNIPGEQKMSVRASKLRNRVKSSEASSAVHAHARANGHGIIMTAGQLASPPPRTPSPEKHRTRQRVKPAVLTSSFKPWELLKVSVGENGAHASCARFVDLKVPSGISLRNFGIQVVSCSSISSSRRIASCLCPFWCFISASFLAFWTGVVIVAVVQDDLSGLPGVNAT